MEVKLNDKERRWLWSDFDKEDVRRAGCGFGCSTLMFRLFWVPTDVPSGVAPTGPSTVSPGSTTVPTSSSIPAAEPIPARSGTTTATPSSPVRDAKKGKGVAVIEPTPTQDKTFKQLEEEKTRHGGCSGDYSSRNSRFGKAE
ncbi:hypothetical protein Tco_0155765 [Tanacetum coccineum]